MCMLKVSKKFRAISMKKKILVCLFCLCLRHFCFKYKNCYFNSTICPGSSDPFNIVLLEHTVYNIATIVNLKMFLMSSLFFLSFLFFSTKCALFFSRLRPRYSYKLVTKNMLRTHQGKSIFRRKKSDL